MCRGGEGHLVLLGYGLAQLWHAERVEQREDDQRDEQMGQMASHGNIQAAKVFLPFVLGRAPEALPIHLQDKTTLDDVFSDMDDFMGR